MRKNYLISFILLFHASFALGECNKESYYCIDTVLGDLRLLSRNDSGDKYSYIYLNKKLIYKDRADYFSPVPLGFDINESEKKVNKIIIGYYSPFGCLKGIDDYKCHANIMIDLTKSKPIVSNIFSPPIEDSHLSWVSWGEKNSIIVFDDDSRFKYENG
ncbi:hypothetical protein, partial [Chimaeribacter coloradensis]|uniref:hypothetical protein n=1 Tax=Chimaeribacter coloradensis TaxID=2060068 RepID=UPI0011AF31B6